MDRSEAQHLIDKIRRSEHILVVVGAGLSRPSGIPTFRNDPWFWKHPVEDSASEAAFQRDPLYVWATYERLRLIALEASPNPAHTALARLARAKPKLLTVSQNIDDLCQRTYHNIDQLVALHGSLFRVCCENKECEFEYPNYTPEPTIPGLKVRPIDSVDLDIASLPLHAAHIPKCPSCQASKLRPGVCWFGEKLPLDELSRVEKWFQDATKVDLVLVIGTERTPFVAEAIAKGADVAWLNLFDNDLTDTRGDWYVDGCASETLPQLVDAALQ